MRCEPAHARSRPTKPLRDKTVARSGRSRAGGVARRAGTRAAWVRGEGDASRR